MKPAIKTRSRPRSNAALRFLPRSLLVSSRPAQPRQDLGAQGAQKSALIFPPLSPLCGIPQMWPSCSPCVPLKCQVNARTRATMISLAHRVVLVPSRSRAMRLGPASPGRRRWLARAIKSTQVGFPLPPSLGPLTHSWDERPEMEPLRIYVRSPLEPRIPENRVSRVNTRRGPISALSLQVRVREPTLMRVCAICIPKREIWRQPE